MPNYDPMATLGKVTPNTRAKAQLVLNHLQAKLGRVPGVLWGLGSSSEHATGRAIDFMVTHHGWGTDNQMGDEIVNYLLDHGHEWGLAWVIWRQRICPAGGALADGAAPSWRGMEDRGSTTENHYDHVHAYFAYDNDPGSPGEEEDMAITDEEIQRIVKAVWGPGGGGNAPMYVDRQDGVSQYPETELFSMRQRLISEYLAPIWEKLKAIEARLPNDIENYWLWPVWNKMIDMDAKLSVAAEKNGLSPDEAKAMFQAKLDALFDDIDKISLERAKRAATNTEPNEETKKVFQEQVVAKAFDEPVGR